MILHLAALALSIAVPVLAAAAGSIWRLNATEQERIEQRIEAAANALAIDFDRELTAYITTLELLATSPRLIAGDLTEFEAQARKAVEKRHWYLLLTDMSGQQLFNTAKPPGATLPVLREREGVRIVQDTGRAYVSDVFVGRIAGGPILAVHQPVVVNGAVKYVIIIGLRPQHLSPLLQNAHLEFDGVATVLDRSGNVILRSQGDGVWSGERLTDGELNKISAHRRGKTLSRSESGKDSLAVWSRSDISGWTVMLSVPRDVLTAVSRRAWLGFAVGGTALLLFAGVLAVFFGREIARPIRSLKRSVTAAGAIAFTPTRLSEANEVAAAFAEAARSTRASEERFRTLAERARDIVFLLSPEGLIVDANAAAVKAYGYARHELIGRSIRDLRAAETHGDIDSHLAQAATTGAMFETVHVRRSGAAFPVEVSATSADIGGKRIVFSIIRDVTGRKRREAALRDREALLETVTQNAGVGLVLLDTNRRYTFVNPAYANLLGRPASDILGKTISDVLSPLYHKIQEHLDRAYAGQRVSFDLDEGSSERSWGVWQVTYQPVRNSLGRVSGMIAVMADITGPKRDAEHIAFLMRELSHRSKNLLAVIQAMARQTSRTSEDFSDFENRFSARIMGLARSHDLLVQQDWQGVQISELIGAHLSLFLDEVERRVEMRGAPLMLQPGAANNIGLALHELATNALKFGALCTPNGTIKIEWKIEHAQPRMFTMTWRESGGPAVEAPARAGFGRHVVERVVAIALNGKAEINFAPDGIVWRLEAPVADIVLETNQTGLQAARFTAMVQSPIAAPRPATA